jgi:hypothetical protein
MKKMIKYSIIIALFIGLAIVTNYMNTHYNRHGKIINIENDEISMLDTTNNIWVWILDDNDNNKYTIGQNVELKMHNNYTDDTIYDDIIENIRLVE